MEASGGSGRDCVDMGKGGLEDTTDCWLVVGMH